MKDKNTVTKKDIIDYLSQSERGIVTDLSIYNSNVHYVIHKVLTRKEIADHFGIPIGKLTISD